MHKFKQTTIKNQTEIIGVGLHNGKPVKLTLNPAPANNGINFFRTDVNVYIPVQTSSVIDTKLATVVGKDGVSISTIEHLLSALSAFGITNINIDIDGDEVPIMDGSAISFCMVLKEAEVETLEDRQKILTIEKEIQVEMGHKFAKLEPSKSTTYDFKISFDHPVIREQSFSFKQDISSYIQEIARARTFGFVRDLDYIKSLGKGLGAAYENTIALDDRRVLNQGGLRFPDEFVRHKILDAVGDMVFIGMPFLGKYTSFAGSHELNSLLVAKLLSDEKNYTIHG